MYIRTYHIHSTTLNPPPHFWESSSVSLLHCLLSIMLQCALVSLCREREVQDVKMELKELRKHPPMPTPDKAGAAGKGEQAVFGTPGMLVNTGARTYMCLCSVCVCVCMHVFELCLCPCPSLYSQPCCHRGQPH